MRAASSAGPGWQIAEQLLWLQIGGHEELMKKGGAYARLISMQGLTIEGRRIDVAASFHDI